MIRTVLIMTMAAFFLSACSSEKSQEEVSFKTSLQNAIKARSAARKAKKHPQQTAQTATASPTHADYAKLNLKMYQISVLNLGLRAPFALRSVNGKYGNYINAGKQSITMANGIVFATRGLGVDLISQGLSVSERQMFPTGGGIKTITRTQNHLSADLKTVSNTYNCKIERVGVEAIKSLDKTFQTYKYQEICRSQHRAFKNKYWININRSGQIVRSEQYMNAESGHLVIEALGI